MASLYNKTQRSDRPRENVRTLDFRKKHDMELESLINWRAPDYRRSMLYHCLSDYIGPSAAEKSGSLRLFAFLDSPRQIDYNV